ncbi:ribonuclease HIII [Vagococcus elongatus]|uniref:Ribonuclease HIII n=1 Tax=Vagococcus elongatus TaxID=180344 RepID=A0A430AM38_9ENTE|nr:ribonuclease HIII [Vagococcus elongatus]RSU09191.1 ribonuclease HIII [Vagococcus elongatus]
MANYSLKKQSPAKLNEMKDYYRKQLSTKVPEHTIFMAKKNGVTITAYKTGTVLFQGDHAEKEAGRWGGVASQPLKGKVSSKNGDKNHLPENFSNWSVIGSDEVGNGSYFGPVVVCACYVSAQQLPLLKELGVKDSKMLKDKDIIKIAKDIRVSVPYQELLVTPSKYNDIQPNYNVNRMKVALHNQAIYLLLKKIAPTTPDGILIDQFTTEASYRRYLSKEKNQVTDNLYIATKGEQHHLAVAAASIICRARFLEELEKASKELSMTIPSGAGGTSDLAAAKILKRGGMDLLRNYAKLHFANTQKALKKL